MLDRSSRRGPLPLSWPGRLSNDTARARAPILPCPVLSCPSSFETTVKLQLEDLPKVIAVVDELRSRLAALRDTVVDGSRNFWVHLVDVTGESAQASAGAAVVVALRATGGVLCAHACLCCLSGLPRRFDDLSLARARAARPRADRDPSPLRRLGRVGVPRVARALSSRATPPRGGYSSARPPVTGMMTPYATRRPSNNARHYKTAAWDAPAQLPSRMTTRHPFRRTPHTTASYRPLD